MSYIYKSFPYKAFYFILLANILSQIYFDTGLYDIFVYRYSPVSNINVPLTGGPLSFG
jgi:hypothetical protein